MHKPELDLDKTIKMGISNIKDIIAFGFDPERTFIFSDVEYIHYLYPNILKISKNVTFNSIKSVFGFNESDNIGKFAFPPVQAAPAFCTSFPHIFGSRKNV